MTQQDLAEELGLNHNTISRWELGLHPIKPKYHDRLIEILGMKPEDFNLY